MADIYSKENSPERYNLICNLKALGKNYKFEKYSTAQLYRIYQKESQKSSKQVQNESYVYHQMDINEYMQAMDQLNWEKEHPKYKITSTGECYIRNDSGGYEYIVEDDLREEVKRKVYSL